MNIRLFTSIYPYFFGGRMRSMLHRFTAHVHKHTYVCMCALLVEREPLIVRHANILGENSDVCSLPTIILHLSIKCCWLDKQKWLYSSNASMQSTAAQWKRAVESAMWSSQKVRWEQLFYDFRKYFLCNTYAGFEAVSSSQWPLNVTQMTDVCW